MAYKHAQLQLKRKITLVQRCLGHIRKRLLARALLRWNDSMEHQIQWKLVCSKIARKIENSVMFKTFRL
jgi:hypothetical protein